MLLVAPRPAMSLPQSVPFYEDLGRLETYVSSCPYQPSFAFQRITEEVIGGYASFPANCTLEGLHLGLGGHIWTKCVQSRECMRSMSNNGGGR